MFGAIIGIPADIRDRVLMYLDERLLKILTDFEVMYPPFVQNHAEDFR